MHFKNAKPLSFPAFYLIAGIAFAVVDADDVAAFRAFIFRSLLFQEFFHAVLFDEFEIPGHAHAVPRAVTKVYRFQAFARHLPAFETEFNPAIYQLRAAALEEGALLVSGAASDAVVNLSCLLRQVVGISQISAAYGAVHAAGSDEFGFHFAHDFSLG